MLARSDAAKAAGLGPRAACCYGPREADPMIQGRSWGAWAVGANGARASGKGESPEDAPLQLAVELKRLSA